LDEFSSFRISSSQKDSLNQHKKFKHYFGFFGSSVVQEIPCIDIYLIRILDPSHTDEGGKIPHTLKVLKKQEPLKTKELIFESSKTLLSKELLNHGIDLNYKNVMKFKDWEIFNRYAFLPLLLNSKFNEELIKNWSQYVLNIRSTNYGPITPKILMQIQEKHKNFINNHFLIFGSEGYITPKTHDRIHFTELGRVFGIGINTRNLWKVY
jgi:hypothetical protein